MNIAGSLAEYVADCCLGLFIHGTFQIGQLNDFFIILTIIQTFLASSLLIVVVVVHIGGVRQSLDCGHQLFTHTR
jgi:hypothetical protein